MNVVIYSRVSSQSARQSTERQVVDLERFAAGRGYEVTAVFEEKISGRKANIERPVLSRCLEYCTDPQNRVDMLLLTEISRLGRSTLEILKSLDTLRGCVKTLTQPFFMRKAQTFSSPGFVITQSFRIFRYKVFRYGKVTFSSLHSQSNRSFSTKN